ncbi:hypothetical protein OUZ56_033482 [Daphnia magna]|uniref:CCHC-type domain-containing protein n=1 Tax=Daphnia magna TaxID=35525 RepID=A0ABQ9ZXX3_9CRUS|nr:hypothetical protein OUZ56_033482 [Daphnia magna]
MSDTDSEIKEPFFGFEHHYHLRNRSQQTDPEPVRPRLVRPVPRYPPNDAAKQRLEFDISPSEASTKTEMADNAALIAALQGFTTAVATDAAARQNQMAQLLQVIGGQQQNQAAMQAIVAAPPNAPVMRPSTVAVNSLPHFSGTASQWHAQTGQNHGTWPLWSAALVTNFSHTLSFLEWSLMVEARVQKPGESCLEYVLDKRRLCLRSPVPLPEADIIKALLRGLANPIYIAALTAQLPVNFTDFVTRLRDLEQLGLSSVQMGIPAPPVTYTAPFNGTACPAPPVVAPPAPPAPNFAALFQNLGDRLVNQISASMSRLAVNPIAGGSRAGGPMPQRGPPQRLCYVCNRNGHIARDCPAKNDASTRQRQWRP